MKLIGMLDSPYVRRVAVSLQLLGLRFEHQSLSVFRHLDAFRHVNPVVKAPTLVCDSGTVLMDSTLILQYAQALARPRTLDPQEPAALEQDLRLTGLALAACEKAVQIVYEHHLRPADKQHAPWLERIDAQLAAACRALEGALARRAAPAAESALTQGWVSTAVAWKFVQEMVPNSAPAVEHPLLAAFSRRAEAWPAFAAAPHGDGTVRAA